MTRRVVVSLAIAADEYLRVYSGTARHVQTIANNGQSVRFPASILRPFVTHTGVHGRFEIRYGDNGRFEAINRLA
ncbi:MAG: DUF2835 domain-containing protein [Pseudomonadota bacterium]